MNEYLQDAEATERLGGRIAEALPSLDEGWLIALEGDLGAGKTTLVRGFLRAMGHQGRVPSPTYTLVEPYELAGGRVLHVDLYRLADPGELEYLGFRDSMGEGATALVEWPERAGDLLSGADLRIFLSMEAGGRRARLEAGTSKGRRLLDGLRHAGLPGRPGTERR